MIDGQGGITGGAGRPQILLDFSANDLLSFISHEVGNPVSAIKGFLDIVLDGRAGSLSPLQSEFLSLASVSANRLSCLIGDISDLRLASRNAFQLECEGTHFDRVLVKVLALLQPLADSKKTSLRNLFADEVPICLLDTKRIERALFNLLSHALKFAPAGSEISVLGERLESRISLYLTGLRTQSLPAEYRGIFDRAPGAYDFGSAGDSSTLGLMIAKYVIENHGGRIWLDGQAEGSARVCLSLPIIQGHDEPD